MAPKIHWFKGPGTNPLHKTKPRKQRVIPVAPTGVRPKKPLNIFRTKEPGIRKPRVTVAKQCECGSCSEINLVALRGNPAVIGNVDTSMSSLQHVFDMARSKGYQLDYATWAYHGEGECPGDVCRALESEWQSGAITSLEDIISRMSNPKVDSPGIWQISHIGCGCSIILSFSMPGVPNSTETAEIYATTDDIPGFNMSIPPHGLAIDSVPGSEIDPNADQPVVEEPVEESYDESTGGSSIKMFKPLPE